MRHSNTPEATQLETVTRVVEMLASGFDTTDYQRIENAVNTYWPFRQLQSEYPDSILVASQLKTLNTDADTLIAALLGAETCAAEVPLDRVKRDYGEATAELIDNVRRLNAMSVTNREGASSEHAQQQTELLRRMLLSMVTDVRAVLVKLAFRTQRLHRLVKHRDVHAVNVARDSMEIYAPLANRLGVGQLKWEMEDLAFRLIDPDDYKRVANALEESRADREAYIRNFVDDCESKLSDAGFVNSHVFGRPKHIYSIWRKMRLKRIEFSDLFDVRAIRVLVGSVGDCYGVLGLVHNEWQPVAGEFDDYIANPKENGYQSLHTAVVGPAGKPVEIQIRTRDMDREAELGVASHWQYKEGSPKDRRMQQSIASLRQLLEQSDDSLVEGFAQQFDSDRVYVFTPKGDVIDLVAGSTPLDFAYHVHSDVGHRCRGAKVNGSIVPLTNQLVNGDRIEILTTREPGPSRDWLNKSLGYLHTSRARSKVRVWFNAQDHEQHMAEGRAILDREMRRLHCTDIAIETVAQSLKFDKTADLFVALGRADVTAAQVAGALARQGEATFKPKRVSRVARQQEKRGDTISVRGVGNLMTQVANCCQPVPYDSIVGFITRGKGVSIHRSDCSNMLSLRDEEQERLIEVEWGDEADAQYHVEVKVIAYDRQGLLRDVSTVMADRDIDVVAVNTLSNPDDQTAEMKLRVAINTMEQLSALMDQLRQLRNVLSVSRIV